MKKYIVWGVILLAGIIAIGTFISYFNREKVLRITFDNETRANQADYDNMWKTIAQKYQIKGDYEQTFKELFQSVADGRKGGSLFKSVQESVPGLDTTIYREMMATIEGKRNQFQSRQMKLSDIKAEHDKLIGTFPGNFICIGATPLQLKMITSSRTDNAFATGQDDEVDLKPRRTEK
jgi:hypothetical protein